MIDLVRYTDTERFALKRIESGIYQAKEACFVTVVVLEDGESLSCADRSILLNAEKNISLSRTLRLR